MNSTTSPTIRIWQQNINKSLISQLHLLNVASPDNFDIILLQEPWFSHTKNTRSSHCWWVLYPNTHYADTTKPLRSIIFINTNIPTNSYVQIQFNSPDVTGVQITFDLQTVLIINVYNDCKNNDAIDEVSTFLSQKFPSEQVPCNMHIILAGDFNRHHSLWEDERNAHLTSSEAALCPLLEIVDTFDLRMALPPRIPTLQALSTGNWTRPDNVWCTNHTTDLFTKCDTNPGLRGPNTDHLPILSSLDVPLPRNPPRTHPNFRATDWKESNDQLHTLLSDHPAPTTLKTAQQFCTALNAVNTSIKTAIEVTVPIPKAIPHTKRWWSKNLSALRKVKNRLANTTHRWQGLPTHPCHQQHKETTKKYAALIERTKKEHWEDWLTNASEKDIWTANKYATDPPTDGSRTRMPTLNFIDQEGVPRCTTSNAEKSEALAKSFSPPLPITP